MKTAPRNKNTLRQISALLLAALLLAAVLGFGLAASETTASSENGTEVTSPAEETQKNPFQKFWDKFSENFEKTFIRKDRYKNFIEGLKNTLVISLFATALGIALGTLVAIVKVSAAEKRSHLAFLNFLCDVYLAVIRGTPVVVQLMMMYYVILRSIDNAILVAVLAFGINSGAYVAEIIRAGINAVDRGQTEAGRSLGLTGGQTMTKIVLPQAIKNILPALGNEFITLIKETSVAGYITIVDLTKAADIVRGQTYEAFFPLIMAAVVYFLIVMLLTKLLRKFERRLARSDRH